jgi:hypothetical protein
LKTLAGADLLENRTQSGETMAANKAMSTREGLMPSSPKTALPAVIRLHGKNLTDEYYYAGIVYARRPGDWTAEISFRSSVAVQLSTFCSSRVNQEKASCDVGQSAQQACVALPSVAAVATMRDR